MAVLVPLIVFFMIWGGVALMIDGYLRRPRRPDLAERLLPFKPSVADEAEVWLRRQD